MLFCECAAETALALGLQLLHGIRSERQLVEPFDYNLLFRWFVGVAKDDDQWDNFPKTVGAQIAAILNKLPGGAVK